MVGLLFFWLSFAAVSLDKWESLISAVVTGTVIGIGQWALLRRCFKRAGWWILASALSALPGALIVQPRAQFLGWGVAAAGGLITGLMLLWLVRQPQR